MNKHEVTINKLKHFHTIHIPCVGFLTFSIIIPRQLKMEDCYCTCVNGKKIQEEGLVKIYFDRLGWKLIN